MLLALALLTAPFAQVPAAATEPAATSEPAATPEAAPEVPAEPPPLTPATSAELVDEAWRRIHLHDTEGARIVAEQALARGDALAPRAKAAIATAWELGGEPGTALALYEELAVDPPPDMADDLRVRIAECLAKLGRYDEALAELAELGDPDLRPYLDARKLHLLRGTWLLQKGDRKAGNKALAAALSGIGSDEVPYYQAQARAAIAKDLCDQAALLSFEGSDRRAAKALRGRTALILAAEDQVTAALHLKEPEWGLEGLLVLGLAYERVADDMIALPPPRSLKTDEQRTMYAATVRERASGLYVKASRYLGEGLDIATRLSWTSPRVPRLREAHERTLAKVAPAAPVPAPAAP